MEHGWRRVLSIERTLRVEQQEGGDRDPFSVDGLRVMKILWFRVDTVTDWLTDWTIRQAEQGHTTFNMKWWVVMNFRNCFMACKILFVYGFESQTFAPLAAHFRGWCAKQLNWHIFHAIILYLLYFPESSVSSYYISFCGGSRTSHSHTLRSKCFL